MSRVESDNPAFTELLQQRPKPDAVLRTEDGQPIEVTVDKAGTRTVMFVHALIDKKCTGWFLVKSSYGLKCMILPHSQDLLLAHAQQCGRVEVAALRVVRETQSGKALVCEVLSE